MHYFAVTLLWVVQLFKNQTSRGQERVDIPLHSAPFYDYFFLNQHYFKQRIKTDLLAFADLLYTNTAHILFQPSTMFSSTKPLTNDSQFSHASLNLSVYVIATNEKSSTKLMSRKKYRVYDRFALRIFSLSDLWTNSTHTLITQEVQYLRHWLTDNINTNFRTFSSCDLSTSSSATLKTLWLYLKK